MLLSDNLWKVWWVQSIVSAHTFYNSNQVENIVQIQCMYQACKIKSIYICPYIVYPNQGVSLCTSLSTQCFLLGLDFKMCVHPSVYIIIFKCYICLFRYGFEQSGLVCAVCTLVDMANAEQQVDVFNVVKQTRLSRPQFITDLVIVF